MMAPDVIVNLFHALSSARLVSHTPYMNTPSANRYKHPGDAATMADLAGDDQPAHGGVSGE
jgi:hypothetical protein